MVLWLLFDGNILITFDLSLDWHHFYLLLRHYFLIVLDALLHCIVILLHHLPRHCLDHFSLLVGYYLSLHRNLLDVRPVFVFHHFLLVGHVAHPALPCLTQSVPFTTY